MWNLRDIWKIHCWIGLWLWMLQTFISALPAELCLPPLLSSLLSLCKRFTPVGGIKVYILVLICSFFPPLDMQHGTQWASPPCSLCSCTHGEVRCTPQPCPPLSCGLRELEFIPHGSCCPVCVGPGSEYELVPRDCLDFWGSYGIVSTLFFFASCGSKISSNLSLLSSTCCFELGREQRFREWDWNISFSPISKIGL